jgi:4-amino-4-deoxy-L-arabinose transferase-like glycosyltransferase
VPDLDRVPPRALARGIRVPERATSRELAAIALIAAVAAALRLHELGNQLWFDEIDTLVNHVRLGWSRILTTYESRNQHLFYSVCARAALDLFGDTPFALRLPAAAFGVASVIASWRFALRVTGRAEALAAAALLALSYQHVWFSQNARGYTGILFFTLAGSALFLDSIAGRGSRGRTLLYGVSMALALYTHLTSLFAVAAHGLVWLALLARRRDLSWRERLRPGAGFAYAAALTLACYAPVLPSFFDTALEPTMPGQHTQWKNPAWLALETLRGLARGLPGGSLAWGVLAGGFALFAAGVWSYARQGVAVAFALLGGAALTAAAMLSLGNNLWPRFFFFAAGFLVLVAVRGLAVAIHAVARGPLARRERAAFAAIAILACAAGASGLRHVWSPKQDFLGALAWVRANAGARDAVATVEMTHLPYEDLYAAGWSRIDNLSDLIELERTHERTYVVTTMPTQLAARQPEVVQRLEARYGVPARVFPGTLAGGEVSVFVHPPLP